MKKTKLLPLFGLTIAACSSLLAGKHAEQTFASFHYNTPTIWKIQSPLNSDWIKIRQDGNGICVEGLDLTDASTEDSRVNGGTINYISPVTVANYEKVKLDGLSLSLVIRNATGATGASGSLGDFAGIFFNTSLIPFSSRSSSMPHFTIFANPYVNSTQSRFVISNGGKYASFNNTSIQNVAPDASSANNSPAASIVMTGASYTQNGGTYWSSGLKITFKSYNSSWWQIQLENYSSSTGTIWTSNTGWNSSTNSATYFLQKSYLSNFVDSSGYTYLHLFGCGITTFAYLYDLSENNSVNPYSAVNTNNVGNGGSDVVDAELPLSKSDNTNHIIIGVTTATAAALAFGALAFIADRKRKKING